jgi:hypothetical protein
MCLLFFRVSVYFVLEKHGGAFVGVLENNNMIFQKLQKHMQVSNLSMSVQKSSEASF